MLVSSPQLLNILKSVFCTLWLNPHISLSLSHYNLVLSSSASIIFTNCRYGLAAPRLMHVFSLPVLFLPTSPPLTLCFQSYCLLNSQQEQSSLVSSSQDTLLPIRSIINTYSFLKLWIFHCETNHNDKNCS